MRIGVSTYSFSHSAKQRIRLEYVMKMASEIELDGLEILHSHMESEENEYLAALKRRALTAGLDIYCLATDQNFVKPSKEQRRRQVEHTQRCLGTAYKLGAPAIRLNSGRWETIDFDELVRRRGVEPPLRGYADEHAFEWVVDSINKCIPAAEEYGVVMALENRLGLTRTAERLTEIVEAVNSEWLRVLMDTGNFLEDIYDNMRAIAHQTVLVHAKTYSGGGLWYTTDIDYQQVVSILRSVDFKGYLSIEHEGRESPDTAIPKALELLTSKMETRRSSAQALSG